MAQREDPQKKTLVSFRKTYDNRIYSFNYEKTEVPGYVSALITVRRKMEGDSKLRVGELVHTFLLQEIDEEYED